MEFSAAQLLEEFNFQLVTNTKCKGKVPNTNISVSIEIDCMGELTVKSFFDVGVLAEYTVDIYEMQLSPRLTFGNLEDPNNWVVRRSAYSPKPRGSDVKEHILMTMQIGLAMQCVASIMEELYGRLPEIMELTKKALDDLDAEIEQDRKDFEDKHQKLTKDMIENVVLPMLKSDAREKGESELTVHTSASSKVTYKCVKKPRSLQFFRGKAKLTEAELNKALQNSYLENNKN